MFIRKMSRLWYIMAIIPYFSALTSDCVIGIMHESEVIQLEQESAVDEDQENILVQGRASFGSKSVTGRACIVTTRKQLSKVRSGDIVIAPAINSFWYAELHLAGGIIIEKADGSGHAIALGKKLDIPVVVEATGAIKEIVDGQIITCDPITRNIYHVAYPAGKDAEFDLLPMQKTEGNRQEIHNKIHKPDKANSSRPLQGYFKSTDDSGITMDCFIQNNKEIAVPAIKQENRIAIKVKNILHSNFDGIKKYVLDMKSDLYKASWLPEVAFRAIAKTQGCDEFAIDCVEIGNSFFARDPKYILEDLHALESEYFINYIGALLEECGKKPGDLNWVAYQSHKAHIESIKLPAGVNKEELIADPKKYKGIEKMFNAKDREEFIREQRKRIGAGVLVRFFSEKKFF